MKTLAFLLLLPAWLFAQNKPCSEYPIILKKLETRFQNGKGNLDECLDLVEALRACDPAKDELAGAWTKKIFEGIKKQKREAEQATRKAELSAAEAGRERDNARAAKENAEHAARLAYANDLAYKSQTALRDGDRTTAFRLAEFAHRYVDDDNLNVTRALCEALYYNDNSDHPPLPWASNLEGHRGAVWSVAFSPDGKKLATGSYDKTAKIWDLESGKALLTLEGHRGAVWSVAFSPDGKKLATGSYDETAKIWDLKSGKAQLTLEGHTSSVSSVAFSPDGKKLATGSSDDIAKIWDLESGKALLTLEGHKYSVFSVTFSPDGKKLATGSFDNTAKIWDLESGKVQLTLKGHMSDVWSVAFSPDGKKLATGSEDKSAKIWDLESGKAQLTLEGHRGAVRSVAFSPDGKKLATGTEDKTAKIWDLESGKAQLTLEGHTKGVSGVAFSPDGKKIATEGVDNTAKIWDLESGKAQLTLEGHKSCVLSVAFSPDGKKLATGSEDKSAKIWDLESGKAQITLEGHKYSVLSVAFSPDGKKLATGSSDNTAKIWDLESGKAQITLKGHSNAVSSVAFSPDGKKLATGSYDNTAKIWELTPEGWQASPVGNRRLAGLSAAQLDAFNLSGLLDIRPGNEALLRQTKDPFQIASFARLYAQKTQNSQDLRRTARDYARAVRLYGYALESGGDSSLLHELGTLYVRWAGDILASDSPDTATYYIESSCKLSRDTSQCTAIREKSEMNLRIKRISLSKDAEELRGYGDYFFQKENWSYAAQAYEKSEKTKHDIKTLGNWYKSATKAGLPFDFQWVLGLKDAGELRSLADEYFKIEMYPEAKQLLDKAERIEHSPVTFQMLGMIAQQTGDFTDIRQMLESVPTAEITAYAKSIKKMYYKKPALKDRIPGYTLVVEVDERILLQDTSTETRKGVAGDYNDLGYYQLFASDGKAAEASIRRAMALDPANKFTATNLAPALLLQGKYKEAETEYKKWAPLSFNEQDLATYRDAFLDDLKALEAAGVKMDFARARGWLEEK